MNAGERGMMKYQPYQSLVEQSTILARMRYEKNKIPKPHISSERAEAINEILTQYAKEDVVAEYWEDGYLHSLEGIIGKIDAVWKYLTIQGKRIEFRQLINLERA